LLRAQSGLRQLRNQTILCTDWGVNLAHWFLLHSPPGNAASNMALDEALLEAMPRLGRPVLRFYSWSEPAASFGYFQKYAEVEPLTPLRPLVRRPTGGGLVPHDHDWTYSLTFPTNHEWYGVAALESYRRVHEWLRAAFAGLNEPTELALQARKVGPGQCFAGYEQFDLLWRGKKIAGAAQRRRRDGLLIQGSVQPPSVSLARAEWEQAMRRVAEVEREVLWQDLQPDSDLTKRMEALARERYALAAYNRRR
jgi:lipoate-protein ligase A